MSEAGPISDLLGQIAKELSLIRPYIPMYLHLLVSAVFPIYAGAHASLSRPSSAASRPKNKNSGEDYDDEGTRGKDRSERRMEGLQPSDAILYPLLTGCMLAGLYFLIKWLDDPAILNKILNWYLSGFGVFSVSQLFSDTMQTLISFIFPTTYADVGDVWVIKQGQNIAISKKVEQGYGKESGHRPSPFPGLFSRIKLPSVIQEITWLLRGLLTQPIYKIEAYIAGMMNALLFPGINDLFGMFFAFAAVLYFNLIDKPWWLTNVLGFSFSYSALQLMSPTTFWTGTLVLIALFFYDIYFVFFTPLMITVAKELDIPVKLLFPRPTGPDDDPTKKALSMLGLGDIVLPGIMIGLALRFDLYLFYLRKQTQKSTNHRSAESAEADHISNATERGSDEAVKKSQWIPATGGWGDRFWLRGNSALQSEGGSFPKTYFHASLVGYVFGMLCTLGVMQVFHHGQPALLYLVPGVLGSIWGTALAKGELKTMWAYSEAEEEKEAVKKTIENVKQDGLNGVIQLVKESVGTSKKESQNMLGNSTAKAAPEEANEDNSKDNRKAGELVRISLSLLDSDGKRRPKSKTEIPAASQSGHQSSPDIGPRVLRSGTKIGQWREEGSPSPAKRLKLGNKA
ncbi:hypothetical protein MMC09_001898 [Bachmanniomyces sp. S44760]|nr:hypothetical protein [Bachmanniomyces sp. S44760]